MGKGNHKFIRFTKELSQKSFTDFFDHYFTRLVQFANTIVKSEVLAEEVVLDVFLNLWGKRNNLHTVSNIETYLYISVRNNAINMLKKEQKFHFDVFEDSVVQIADYKMSMENQIIESEMLDMLNSAVKRLPSKCKIIFKLIREDGLSRREVAEILNISVKTVDNQVAIAVTKIAEQLGIDLSNPNKSSMLTTFLFTL